MSKFLDSTGLTYFYGKLKTKFILSDLSNLSDGSISGAKIKTSTITEDQLSSDVKTKLNSSTNKTLHIELNPEGASVDYDGTEDTSFSYNEIVTAGTINNALSCVYFDNTGTSGYMRITESTTDETESKGIDIIGPDNDANNPEITINSNGINSKNGFFEKSDARKKDFKENISVDFNKLKEIPKKYFTWKDDKNNKLNIGTSAQEIQKLYPELVKEDNGVLSVDYAKLSIIALAAIDKLNERVESLEKEIKEIKSK